MLDRAYELGERLIVRLERIIELLEELIRRERDRAKS
jgi:hypothetical protein